MNSTGRMLKQAREAAAAPKELTREEIVARLREELSETYIRQHEIIAALGRLGAAA